MLKKLFFLVLIVLALSLSACSDKAEALYQAGTYTAESSGHNGPMTVEVTFSETEISEIKILEHVESAGLSDPAIERIPARIIEGQTLEVDIISGATITSDAIIEAVGDCIQQAGVDAEA
ncbi:MAG: FMN-binding protein [Firmicutes bacterium]|nr:FMN-binding protein [Bacillota bacterium]